MCQKNADAPRWSLLQGNAELDRSFGEKGCSGVLRSVLSKSSLKRAGEALSLHPPSPSSHGLRHLRAPVPALAAGNRDGVGPQDGAGLYLLRRSAGSSRGPSSSQGRRMQPQGCGSLLQPQALTLLGSSVVSLQKHFGCGVRRKPSTFPKYL